LLFFVPLLYQPSASAPHPNILSLLATFLILQGYARCVS
jgi:hypothetical protein